MKLTALIIIALFLCSCVYKQEKISREGVVMEEKYIIKRPIKDFVEKVEFE